MNWAACSFSGGTVSREESRRQNTDLSQITEADALKHVLHSLTSLGLAYDLEFEDALLHGEVQGDEGFVQVLAIRGDTYQDCRLHYDRFVPKHGTDPVLVVGRDRDNLTPVPEEFLKIDEIENEYGLAFIDYQTLISNCRNAADNISLKGVLDDILPRHRRFI